MILSKHPLVSVIMPTYKRATYLERAIASVLEQTYPRIELIIVDDNGLGTTDGQAIEQIMVAYADDPRVRYIQHEVNQHGGAARNTGIQAAKGELITFLDDDDTYRPDKIAQQVTYLQAHSEHQAVYCGWQRGTNYIFERTGDLSYELLSSDQIILTNTIMMYREAAVACGGFDVRLKRHQEAVFLLRYFATGGTIGVVSQVLVDYDMSDRQNAEEDARRFEELTTFYLDISQPFIERVVAQQPDLEKKIWVHRWRGNLLYYLKMRNLRGALSFYWRKGWRYPFYFHQAFLTYVWEKLFN